MKPWHYNSSDHIDRQKQQQTDHYDKDNHGKHFVKGVGLFHPGHVNTQAAEAAQPSQAGGHGGGGWYVGLWTPQNP